MPALFLESSAIVKRYASETGSAWVVNITDPVSGNQIYLARITEVEVASAITRRTREGKISVADADVAIQDLHNDFAHQYRVVEIAEDVIGKAISLVRSHGLKAYDAVQLASALEVDEDRVASGLTGIILISADGPLNNAAAAKGLAVDDPNNHP